MDFSTLREHPAAALLPMLGDAELAELAADIKTNGLRVPVALIDVGGEWQILDGRNRARACKLAGVHPAHTIWSGKDPIAYVLSVNLHRRHLNASQRAMLALAVEEMYAALAVGRKQRDHGGKFATSEVREGKSRDTAAKQVNVSGRSVQTAKRVAKACAPEVVTAVRDGRIAVDDAVRVAKESHARQAELLTLVDAKGAKTLKDALNKTVKSEVVASIQAEPQPLPAGPFRVIVADPPWRYSKRVDDVTHRGANPYPTMSVEEICAMPVVGMAHEDAVLWLWTTNAFMRDAFKIVDAWGFREKTILTWAKDRMGVGDWLRGQTEHCILAVRGSPVITLSNQTTLLTAPMREHSRKPDEFFRIVETLCHGSRVELFAREPREGWTAWGAESSKFAATAAGR